MGLVDSLRALFGKGDCMHAIVLPQDKHYICIANKLDCEYLAGKTPEYITRGDDGNFGNDNYLICPKHDASNAACANNAEKK